MTSYYGEVGPALAEAGGPGTSLLRASQSLLSRAHPGTESKESPLSRTKLFNVVISRIFFIPSPPVFAGLEMRHGGEKYDALLCILIRDLGYPYPSRLGRTVPQQ